MTDPQVSIDPRTVRAELENHFPEYSFFSSWRLAGKCLVAKNTPRSGADIFIRKQQIVVEAAIPEWATRFKLGAGAAYLKMTDNQYSEPAKRIAAFLQTRYPVNLKA